MRQQSKAPQAAEKASIDPFRVMEVVREAQRLEAQNRAIHHLEVGQPSEGAPPAALAAVERSLRTERLGYSDALGRPELRRTIAEWYAARYGMPVDAGQVIVTDGASGALVLALLAIVDNGTRVGVTEPGYPCYRQAIRLLGGEAAPIAVGDAAGFQPTVDQLDEIDPIDALVCASPMNPTGSMLSPERFSQLSSWCAEQGTWLVSDEIYHGLTYGISESTAAGLGHAITVNSFSKFFCMTGWRIGWMVAPERLVETVDRIAQNLFLCPPVVSQVAALGAFDDLETLQHRASAYPARRDLLIDGLRAVGFEHFAPADGAFYLWADASHLGMDSSEVCARWLHEAGVAVTPGIDFDHIDGARFVRFSYAQGEADLVAAIAALTNWFRSRHNP